MSNTKDAIQYALSGDLADMTASIETAIKEKVAGALEAKKIEIGKSMFNPVAESIEDFEDEYDEEDEEDEDELYENHSMHTHTVHFSSPETGEWKGKMLINADSDKEAVADAHGMAKKHGLKVMRVSRNNSVMVDKTIGEEVVYESESPEKVLMGLKYGKAMPKKEEPEKVLMGLKYGKAMPKKEEFEQVDEVLDPSMGVQQYIHDFVHSKNPKFAGKSKKDRIQMALGAFYSAKRGK
jgi:hypothetical protein